MIDSFDKEYAFLSNFYDRKFIWKNFIVTTAEHAFQLEKTVDPYWRQEVVRAATPGQAKRLGRKVTLRTDWESVKQRMMEEIVRAKFTQHADLAAKLVATGNEQLIEGNSWHDNIWGNCKCDRCINITGKNLLGQILMKIRAELT